MHRYGFVLLGLFVAAASSQSLSIFATVNAERYFTTEGYFVSLVSFGAQVIPVKLGHSVGSSRFLCSPSLIILH